MSPPFCKRGRFGVVYILMHKHWTQAASMSVERDRMCMYLYTNSFMLFVRAVLLLYFECTYVNEKSQIQFKSPRGKKLRGISIKYSILS